MEKVHLLIHRLKEQLDQQASNESLLISAQMLVIELQQKHLQKSTSKVAVTMPYRQQQDNITPPTEATIIEIPQPLDTEDFITEEEIVAKEEAVAFKHHQFFDDAFANLPTVAFQEPKEVYALNDMMMTEEENVNTKWQAKQVEVATVLEKSPIKDLKKAINVNDRYLFINELFRGDEAMYERSLKTIQGFSILPEAIFWIQRELKVKLGWQEGSPAVKLFDQLVSRRFS
ncbi:hypothetical protein ACFOW1_11410 [Parasediminibacterium paludis]|uniref:Uncharacterized protein n=1 Tax=Parasediminibacterium paludis TaxID=908966 RepID=A0ABV8PY77_9BACT